MKIWILLNKVNKIPLQNQINQINQILQNIEDKDLVYKFTLVLQKITVLVLD